MFTVAGRRVMGSWHVQTKTLTNNRLVPSLPTRERTQPMADASGKTMRKEGIRASSQEDKVDDIMYIRINHN